MKPFRIWLVPSLFASVILISAPAAATLYFVCPDGSGDYETIQDAIDAAAAGDIIELCDTTFTGRGNREIDYRGKAITVRSRSGTPEACIIDCQGFLYHGFHFYSGEGPESVLEGVTIVNGNHSDGAGILIQDSSPAITNCILRDNAASQGGGGIECENSSTVITDCTFRGNSAFAGGGGIYAVYGAVSVARCEFHDNSAAVGGGLSCLTGSPTVTNCTFSENVAQVGSGGLDCLGTHYATITNCTFYGNDGAEHGGGMGCSSNSPVLITNCTFVHNQAASGGGVSSCNSSPILEKIIIAYSLAGGSFFCYGLHGNDPELSCCDIYGNVGGDWVECIADHYGIKGNICQDPLFCGEANPEEPFTLHSDSPCAPDYNPACGLIGAWPVGCGESSSIVRDEAARSGALRLVNIPNPFGPATRITYSVPGDACSEPVALNIYDAAGRLVRTLVNARQPAGTYSVTWDGTDRGQLAVAQGVYFYQLSVDGRTETRRMVLIP